MTGGIGRQVRAKLLSPFVRQRLTFFISAEDRRYIEPLAEHIRVGAVQPLIGDRVDLDDVADAIGRLAEGSSLGKTVVSVR